MNTSTLTTRIVMMLALLALPTIASAQHTDTEEQPSLGKQYETSLLRMAIDFWTPKLNSYRIEIDRMLSASDLVEVNELRTRAALMLERIQTIQKKQEARARERMSESDYATTMADTARYVPTPEAMEGSGMPTYDTAMVGEEVSERIREQEMLEQQREWERQRAEQLKEDVKQLELVLAGTDDVVKSNSDAVDARAGYDHYDEYAEQYELMEGVNQLRYVTRWIARNYRPGMDELMAKIYVDLDEFFDATRKHSRDFINAHGPEALESERLVDRMLDALRGIREAQMLKDATGPRAEMARSTVESVLMVYNGQDIREILMIDGSPVASATAATLPAGNMLGQNSPNPASSRTTIPYTLSEPGSRVVIQLLDTRGTLVATFDQGSRESGEHSASIDVSTLAPGTYLYQLKVSTAAGERVSSKGMQVVR